MWTRAAWSLILVGCLVACSPQATPFPVNSVATPTATVSAGVTAPAPLRYAIAANARDLVADLALIQQAAQIEQLTESFDPNDLGKRYDLVVGYGDLLGGARSPVLLHVFLGFDASQMPTDAVPVLRRALDTQALVESLNLAGVIAVPLERVPRPRLQTELANAGWPDGFDLSPAVASAPGSAQIQQQLQAIGIEVIFRQLPANFSPDENSKAALILGAWKSPEERAGWAQRWGEQNILDLYTVPISYVAMPGLKITFTPAGWPLPSR
jgi:hypothetical protein